MHAICKDYSEEKYHISALKMLNEICNNSFYKHVSENAHYSSSKFDNDNISYFVDNKLKEPYYNILT